jgi:hypothetical protein
MTVALFHLEKYSFADKEAKLERLTLEKEIADSQKAFVWRLTCDPCDGWDCALFFNKTSEN